jgi:putative spermidine/putrescine transport system ATP-binding protein
MTEMTSSAGSVQRSGKNLSLEIVDARRSFDKVQALDGLSIALAPGEFVALLGPSGCGKTTALRAVAGLEQLDSGAVLVGGTDVTHLPPHRRQLGMVFQAYSLFPNMNALDNVAFGLEVRKVPVAKRRARAGELLDLVGLGGMGRRFAHELSGGQQQRVALARALCAEPDLLLLDEPLSALDAKVRGQLRDEIRRIQIELGITTLFVTHDQEEALSMSDRVGVMRNGRLEQLAAPAEVYSRPATDFVAQFVGSVSRLPGEVVATGRVDLMGSVLAVPPGAGAALPVGTAVDVLVRPESVRLRPSPTGSAVIARSSFLGATVRVVATLSNGVEVSSTLPAGEGSSLPPGSRAEVELLNDVLFVVPRAAVASRPGALVGSAVDQPSVRQDQA